MRERERERKRKRKRKIQGKERGGEREGKKGEGTGVPSYEQASRDTPGGGGNLSAAFRNTPKWQRREGKGRKEGRFQ